MSTTVHATDRDRASPSSSSLLSWFVFPLLLIGVTAFTSMMLARGAPLPLVSSSALVSSLILVMIIERIAPLHREWNARPSGIDLALIVGNRLVDIAVVGGTVTVLAKLESAGARMSIVHVWPTSWPLPLQALFGIVLAEALRYALHRLSHRPGLLWRIHVLHHGPKRMYALNGPRLHPGNQLWIAIANTVPMLVLGAELPAVVLAASLTAFFVIFQHANVKLRFDGLHHVFATPDVHRMHHARERASENDGVNYGIVLLVFDRLFGTYCPPEAIGAEDIGLRGGLRVNQREMQKP